MPRDSIPPSGDARRVCGEPGKPQPVASRAPVGFLENAKNTTLRVEKTLKQIQKAHRLVHSQSSWQPAPRLLLCPERSEGCLVSFQRCPSPPKPRTPENTFPGVRGAAGPPFQRSPQRKRRPPTSKTCPKIPPLLWGRSTSPFQGRTAFAVVRGGASNAGTPPGQAPGPGGGQARGAGRGGGGDPRLGFWGPLGNDVL